MKLHYWIILLLFVSINVYSQEESESVQTAPNFELEDIEGEYVELSEVIGDGPVLLSFWATWCKPCIEELKEFNKLYEEYESKGFKMYAISTDSERSIAKVKPFVKSKNYSFPVLLDTNSEVARRYYANAVPYSVIIDSLGAIVYSHLGYTKGDELKVREIIENLL